jgi:hypothetical protein
MDEIVRELKIDSFSDREQIYSILARNGYKVWEKRVDVGVSDRDFFVCYEEPRSGEGGK